MNKIAAKFQTTFQKYFVKEYFSMLTQGQLTLVLLLDYKPLLIQQIVVTEQSTTQFIDTCVHHQAWTS